MRVLVAEDEPQLSRQLAQSLGEAGYVVDVAGRLVVDGGRVLTIDEPALLDEAERVGRMLGEVLGPRRYRALREVL